jgi:phosphohistidine phosphatase
VAAVLARHPSPPSLALCSSAKRTLATLAPILDALGARLRVEIEPDLYLAGAEALLARIARIPERERSAMLIGHNPGLHELAVQLAARGARGELARLRAKLPTAALAILELDVAHWRDVGPGCATLLELWTPRERD